MYHKYKTVKNQKYIFCKIGEHGHNLRSPSFGWRFLAEREGMKKQVGLALALLALSAGAQAQVFKCVDGKGGVTFSQVPCAAPARVCPPSRMPVQGAC